MSYLNAKIAERLVVPVQCEASCGTAFFIGPTQLLTARHVVKAHFQSSKMPVHIIVSGKKVLCRAEELSIPNEAIDIALLTIVDDYEAIEYLTLLCDDFVPNLSLCVCGYPEEVAMGMNLVNLKVKNRLKIDGGVWNDRALVREDTLHLHHYDGLSGSPVISKSGRVVGIVVIQINETLSYLSIEKIQQHLKLKGIHYDIDWAKDDITTLGSGRSHQQCEDAVATIHDRYMPDLHQHNDELELKLDFVINKKVSDKSIQKAKAFADCVSKLPKMIKDNIREKLKIGKEIDVELLLENNCDLLHRCYDYIETFPFQHFTDWDRVMVLNQLAYQLKDEDFERLKVKNIKNLCLIGKAGSGKTHSLCDFSLKNQDKANIYLFFGTNFNEHESAISHIKNIVCQDLSIEDYNNEIKKKTDMQ